MASSTTIPRFLLPQLSWEAITLQSSPVINPARCLRRSQQLMPLQRSITSRTTPWQKSENVSSPLQLCRPSILPTHLSFLPSNATRSFSAAPTLYRDHHFDTLKFVQRLKAEGFSEEQSKAMMLVLSDVIEESIQNLTRTMVLKEGNRYPLPTSSYPPPTSSQPNFNLY